MLLKADRLCSRFNEKVLSVLTLPLGKKNIRDNGISEFLNE